MIDKINHIKANGVTYPVAYTLNVMEEVQEEFGSIDKWANAISPKDKKEANIKALVWTYEHFINEGIDIENETLDEKRPFISHKQAGRILTSTGLEKATETIQDATIAATKTDEPKN